jgi:hypothetical protein
MMLPCTAEAAGGEVVVDVLGELEQAQLEGFLVGPLGQHVDDAVILVGGQGLLVAALGAEGQPGVFDAVQVVAVEVELEDAAGEGVVEGRDELGELLGADALGEQVEGQLADVAAGALQGLDVGGALDAGADLAQADALQREQVALGDHALQPVFGIDHQDVAHAVGGHLEGCVVGAGAAAQGVGRGGHHVGDGPGEVEAGEHDALEDVALGEHADGLSSSPATAMQPTPASTIFSRAARVATPGPTKTGALLTRLESEVVIVCCSAARWATAPAAAPATGSSGWRCSGCRRSGSSG